MKANKNTSKSVTNLVKFKIERLVKIIETMTNAEVKKQGASDLEFKVNEIMKKLDRIENQPKRSYASVAAPKEARKQPDAVVIVKPIEAMKCFETKKIVQEKLNQGVHKRNVRSFKNTKDGGIIIGCTNNEAANSVIKKINESTGKTLTARQPKSRKPKMIVFGVDQDVEENSVIDEIIDCNSEIKKMIDEDEVNKSSYHISFIKKMKAKYSTQDRSFFHYIFEVSTELRKTLKKHQKVRISWRNYKIDDYVNIIRCFNCQRFGHLAKDCKSEATCGKCAEQHKTADCKNSNAAKCINCTRTNLRNKNNKLNNCHSVSSEECPSYQKIAAQIRSSFNHC